MQRDFYEVMAVSMRRNAVARGYDGPDHATADEVREKFEALGGTCVYCECNDQPMSPDHDIPITRGGSNGIDNVVPSCLRCNIRKSARTGVEYRAWLVDHPWPEQPTVAPIPPAPRTAVPSSRRGRQAQMTVKEVASFLQLDRPSVLQFIETGELPAYDVAPCGSLRKNWRIDGADLEAWIGRRRRPK